MLATARAEVVNMLLIVLHLCAVMCTAVLCIIDADWRTRGNDCNHPVFCQSVLTMIRDGWAADHQADVTLTTVTLLCRGHTQG